MSSSASTAGFGDENGAMPGDEKCGSSHGSSSNDSSDSSHGGVSLDDMEPTLETSEQLDASSLIASQEAASPQAPVRAPLSPIKAPSPMRSLSPVKVPSPMRTASRSPIKKKSTSPVKPRNPGHVRGERGQACLAADRSVKDRLVATSMTPFDWLPTTPANQARAIADFSHGEAVRT